MVYGGVRDKSLFCDFEVDSTESVWYNGDGYKRFHCIILKLTPQSQYGIQYEALAKSAKRF